MFISYTLKYATELLYRYIYIIFRKHVFTTRLVLNQLILHPLCCTSFLKAVSIISCISFFLQTLICQWSNILINFILFSSSVRQGKAWRIFLSAHRVNFCRYLDTGQILPNKHDGVRFFSLSPKLWVHCIQLDLCLVFQPIRISGLEQDGSLIQLFCSFTGRRAHSTHPGWSNICTYWLPEKGRF